MPLVYCSKAVSLAAGFFNSYQGALLRGGSGSHPGLIIYNKKLCHAGEGKLSSVLHIGHVKYEASALDLVNPWSPAAPATSYLHAGCSPDLKGPGVSTGEPPTL